jgi:PhnB protein
MAVYPPQRETYFEAASAEDRMADDLNANKGGNNARAIPEGYHTLTPWIIVDGAARLIEFLEKAFGMKEAPGTRFHNTDGTIGHVEVRIGDSVVMLFDSRPDWPPTPSFLRLYVADADATYRQALSAGATSVTEVAEHFFGDRIGRVSDPAGNIWWIQSHSEDVKPEEMFSRMSGPNKYTDAMQEAQTSLARELSRRK